jgi:hypothetical protein
VPLGLEVVEGALVALELDLARRAGEKHKARPAGVDHRGQVARGAEGVVAHDEARHVLDGGLVLVVEGDAHARARERRERAHAPDDEPGVLLQVVRVAHGRAGQHERAAEAPEATARRRRRGLLGLLRREHEGRPVAQVRHVKDAGLPQHRHLHRVAADLLHLVGVDRPALDELVDLLAIHARLDRRRRAVRGAAHPEARGRHRRGREGRDRRHRSARLPGHADVDDDLGVANLDDVAGAQRGLVDGLPIHPRARAQVDNLDVVGLGLDDRVHPRHALIIDAEVGLLIATDLDDILRDGLRAHDLSALADLKRKGYDQLLCHCSPVCRCHAEATRDPFWSPTTPRRL